MSFKIGQKRYSVENKTVFFQSGKSQTENDAVVETFTTKVSSIQFKDKRIPYNFETDQNYYIKLKIQRKNTQQNITLKLTNGDDVSTVSQEIDNFTIYPDFSKSSAGDSSSVSNNIYQDINIENSYAIVEFIVSPNSTYSYLTIVLDRELADFGINKNTSSGQENGISQSALDNLETLNLGRVVQISSYQIQKLQNLLDNIQAQKIGIQGPTGMLMCINGEGIRIGPSGIYEIKNGYKVNFLGVVRGQSQDFKGSFGRDSFIIDYQYNSNQISDTNNEEGE